MVIAVIMRGAGASAEDLEGMRYSWAVLSPQWYLVVVGRAGHRHDASRSHSDSARPVATSGSARASCSCSSSVMIAVAIATLVQIEMATSGWWIGAHMFDALWYGQTNWFVDFYTTLRAAAARALHRREHHDGLHALAHARHDDPPLQRDRARARDGRRGSRSARAGRPCSSGSARSASSASSRCCS